jgi:hypothetical protein
MAVLIYAVDINPYYDPAKSPSLILFNSDAIEAWLKLTLTSPPMSSTRIFSSLPGTQLMAYLQEPIDDKTAFGIRNEIVSRLPAIDSRVTIDSSGVIVTPDPDYMGYNVSISGTVLTVGTDINVSFLLTR